MPTITTSYRGDRCFAAEIGRHTLVIDVPADLGGSDRGPTPPELFIASLGSCTAATLAIYCEGAGIDVEGLIVDVGYATAENPTRLTDVCVTVRLPHAECAGKREELLRVLRNGLVHETIVARPEVRFEVLDRAAPVGAV